MKHRLLLSEAGGALTNGVIESLRIAHSNNFIVGVSSDVYALQLAAVEERCLVPEANDPDFILALNDIIDEFEVELVISQHDSVIKALSDWRDELDAPVFLPSKRTIDICQNKQTSNDMWAAAGLKVPKAFLLTDIHDLDNAFAELGPDMWLRAIHGGYGKGSLPTGILQNPDPGKSFRFAKLWIDAQHGWGRFQAAEHLTNKSVTWLSIWREGRLVVAQGRKRHYWKYNNRNLSGVTGITGVGETVSDSVVDNIAQEAIAAIDDRPHGIYCVDMTYDKDGTPNPTEINIGRFFTTHLFFAAAGLNVSEILVNTFFNEPIQPLPRIVNPLEPGLCWVREMDTEPTLVRPMTVMKYQQALEDRLRVLKGLQEMT